MTAILFGSISSLADTSELQREAFNQAFRQHGLDWQWGREDYVAMLGGNGGQDRIASFAADRGEEVDAAAVHATKSQLFQQALSEQGVEPREGVLETIRAAREAGTRVALVTTTSPENVAALSTALADQISFDDEFALVVDATQVDTPKPDGAAYRYALAQLGEDAASCVAVEDNVGGVDAARSADVAVVAFPNANTATHDFGAATATSERLSYDQLIALAG